MVLFVFGHKYSLFILNLKIFVPNMCQFFNSVTNQTSLSPNDEPEINVLDLPYYAILTLHSAMANVEISLNEG